MIGNTQIKLVTAPNIVPPVFTLTCTSTGGPASTVTWRRNGVPLTADSFEYAFTQVITNAVEATYGNVLTVRAKNLGDYTCSIGNTRTRENVTGLIKVEGNYDVH